MANSARAALESALRLRKLDRTLTTVLPSIGAGDAETRIDPSALAATNVAVLDASLRGGLPRGQLSEITGPRTSGRTSLLFQLYAAATQRGDIAAHVDTFDRLDVASAAAAGIALDRLLWIRGQAITRMQESGFRVQESGFRYQESGLGQDSGIRIQPGPAGLFDRTLDRALKALNLILQAGGFGVVAIDLVDVPPVVLKRIPFTTWLRVQRIIEGSDTACVLLTPEPLSRSAGGLTLTLTGRSSWTGDSDRSRRLAALDVTTRLVSPRRRVEGEVALRAVANDSH